MHREIFSEWTEFFSGLIVTDRYRGVLLHLLFASSSLTGKAGVGLRKKATFWRQDFRRNSFAQNWSRITKNLSHRFLLSRKTAAAWAAMPFTTLTNLTSLSLWAAQRAELSPTQKAKEFTEWTPTSQSLCNWSHGFSGSSSGAKLHHRKVTMRLKLSSTQPTFCLSPPPPVLLGHPAHRPTLKCLCLQVISDQGHQGYSLD